MDVTETLKSVPVKGTPAKNQNHKQGKTNKQLYIGGWGGSGHSSGIQHLPRIHKALGAIPAQQQNLHIKGIHRNTLQHQKQEDKMLEL